MEKTEVANRAIERDSVSALLMCEKPGSRAFRATRQISVEYDALAVKRGEQTPPSRLQFQWKMGSRTPDDVVLTDDCDLLVSVRFLQSIERLSGWSSFPVKLELPSGQVVEHFHCLVITGRAGRFLQDRTTKIPANATKVFDTYKGLCFAMPENLGVCMPMHRELDLVYVSKDFAAAVRPYAAGTLDFIPCDEVITPPWVFLGVIEKTSMRMRKGSEG